MNKHVKSMIVGLLVIATCSLSFALAEKNDVVKSEKYYVEKYCKGEKEVVLVDRTRVDCMMVWNNETHVIEFDWAYKYQEAYGQSIYYSVVTGKKAGIVLILRDEKDIKYLKRLQRMNMKLKHPINIKVVEVE